jgi:hypothetical protein
MSLHNYEKSNLTELLACSLHQDWRYDFESPESSIDDTIEGYEVEELKEMHTDLENILYNPKIPKDSKTLRELGCFYNPEADGESIQDWLARLGRRIEQEINSKAKK